jgi:transposase InsO family protein
MTLVSLAMDSSLRHLSTKSLMFYAQRNKILSCGLDTWYKYMKMYKITRKANLGSKKKKYLQGIRAEQVNQIWHIDVTEFQTIRGPKLYLQLIVDNFSRAIVSWNVSDRRDLELTLKSLRSFKEGFIVPEYLLSDAGKENTNKTVNQILLGRGVTQLIAKSDVIFSNSMVEAVFRQLKQKFIQHKPESKSDLIKSMVKFVEVYNFKIPHSSLIGGTPMEVFLGKWDSVKFAEDVLSQRRFRMLKRTKDYQLCTMCIQEQA